LVSSLDEIDELLLPLDGSLPYPGGEVEGPRGRTGTPKRPSLPEGWLDSRELSTAQGSELQEAELDVSGG
ncbi:MAG: tRNA dihydrouridine synthase DusB, partial [Microbacteriaceae bacterium]